MSLDFEEILAVVEKISGCTFASIDSITQPKPGITCRASENVILFTNKNSSGYENKVRRHLEQAGLDADGFHVGDLSWGVRIPETPLIEHKGKHYLQCISLNSGEWHYYAGDTEINPEDFGIRPARPQWGLEKDTAVYVHAYKLESIVSLRIMGETLQAVA